MAEFYTDDGFEQELNEAEIVSQARADHTSVASYQARIVSNYMRLHHYYAPVWGDHWPEDAGMRPGKIHMTANYCKAVVDISARVQAIIPKVKLLPTSLVDQDERRRAEAAEKLMQRYLDLSAWDVWLADLTTTKSLYGRGIVKVFWNTEDKRPDVVVLESPGNLYIGWGSDDYRVMDWALFEYSISPLEFMRRYKQFLVQPDRAGHPMVIQRIGDHSDPLNQKLPVEQTPRTIRRIYPYQPSDYENKQVVVWDYWYKDSNGNVWNAIIAGDHIVDGPHEHTELPDIPYVVIENQHEPGSPTGVSDLEPIIDHQVELNRAISHWEQLVADEVDPAWQLTGENADSLPDGIVPRGGEIVPVGSGNEIKPIPKGINIFPAEQLITELKAQIHDLTGLPAIMFGESPYRMATGRALAIHTESVMNRMDFKRRRLYAGIREILIFWSYMLEKVNPSVSVTMPDGSLQSVKLGDAIKGLRNWKIVAPEITPKDEIEMTTNALNKVQGKLLSLRSAMDEIGVDSPEDEVALIEYERSNPHLFPGETLTYVQVMAALQSLQASQAQQAQQQAQDQTGPNVAAATAQQGSPQLGQDQNQAQPLTLPGSAPPPGAPTPNGVPPVFLGQPQGRTILRATPSGQVNPLSQISIQRPLP